MELSNDQLQEVERLSAAAYTPREVAFILGIKPAEFIAQVKDEDSEAAIAYFKGLYSSELNVRESILLLARNGSSPAQTMANKLFDENRRQLIKGGFSSPDE